jgi:hypothetical protein
MKQFQVVQQNPDLNNGLIIANFGLPILIAPNSQITLDKFQATIDETLTGIKLSDQTIYLTTDGVTQFPVFIPANNYQNVSNLITVFNDKVNGVFNAYDDNLGLAFNTVVADNQIGFYFKNIEASSSPPNSLVNCGPNNNIYIMQQSNPSLFFNGALDNAILNGGGFICTSQMQPDKVGGQYSVQYGLTGIMGGQLNQKINILQSVAASPTSYGVVTLTSTITNQTVSVPSTIFTTYLSNPPLFKWFVSFYQYNGYYACKIEVKNASNVVVDTFIYQGSALGAWSSLDITSPYFSGTSTQVLRYFSLATNPGFGNFYFTSVNIIGGNIKTVRLNFGDSADQLRLGFGLSPDIVILQPIASNQGSYASANNINFSSIRSALSLSIEVMELPLESYLVGSSPFQTKNPTSGSRQQGSRVNVIAYFVPQVADIASNIYRYQSSNPQWLDIVNKQPMEFTSLNFRVYVTETNQPLQANNLSFNFLTRSEEEKFSKSEHKKYMTT